MGTWTPAMDSILKAGWQAGLSEPQIAAKVAAQIGVASSRHSVSSRRRRLHLPDRAPQTHHETLVLSNQIRRRDFTTPLPAQPPKGYVNMKVFQTPLPGTTPRPWLTRAFGECAWPVQGEMADTYSCCDPVENPMVPYCPRHMAKRHAKSVGRK